MQSSAIEPSFNQVKAGVRRMHESVGWTMSPTDTIYLAMLEVTPTNAVGYFRWAGYARPRLEAEAADEEAGGALLLLGAAAAAAL